MSLVRAELERLGSRRFVQLMVALLALAFVVTAVTSLVGSRRPTPDELQQAQTQAAARILDLERDYARCVIEHRGDHPPGDIWSEHPLACTGLDPGRMDRLPVAGDFLEGVFTFATEARGLLYFLVAFLVLFGFLVGASFIGADLNSGGVVNLLLWRPRRLTVLATKLGTLLGAVLLLAAVATVLYLGSFWTIGQLAGLPGTLDAEFWRSLATLYARGTVLVLLATVLGFSLATLGRHTAAALGTVAAYAVVWELGARLVMEIVSVPRVDQWMLSSHIGAWLTGRVELWGDLRCDPSGCTGAYALEAGPSLAVLASLTAGLCLAAFTAFRHRDLI
jgi:hypothetical protein